MDKTDSDYGAYKKQEMTCARCGLMLDVHNFIQNSQMLRVLGLNHMFHFCETCIKIIKKFER